MYNALWAPRHSSVVEIMPVRKDGLYAGQGSADSMPPFAHLAIFTNCVMNGQPFYRFYQVSDGANFDLDVNRFLAWMEKYLPMREKRRY